MGFRMKCARCCQEITLRSGEELNREWVQEYYQREYLSQSWFGAEAGSAVPANAVQ